MSKLRQKILEQLRILGNHSGCHQLPERSFFYQGKQFPVCARCTGVTIGQLLALIFGIFRCPSLIASALCTGIMGLDWGIQYLNIRESNNRRRFLTGILGGFGVFSCYIYAVRKLISWLWTKKSP